MIKVEAIEQFSLKEFDKLKNIKRKNMNNIDGLLRVGDIFECDEKMVKYLTGNNEDGKVVVKVIEVEPKIKVAGNDEDGIKVDEKSTKYEVKFDKKDKKKR